MERKIEWRKILIIHIRKTMKLMKVLFILTFNPIDYNIETLSMSAQENQEFDNIFEFQDNSSNNEVNHHLNLLILNKITHLATQLNLGQFDLKESTFVEANLAKFGDGNTDVFRKYFDPS